MITDLGAEADRCQFRTNTGRATSEAKCVHCEWYGASIATGYAF